MLSEHLKIYLFLKKLKKKNMIFTKKKNIVIATFARSFDSAHVNTNKDGFIHLISCFAQLNTKKTNFDYFALGNFLEQFNRKEEGRISQMDSQTRKQIIVIKIIRDFDNNLVGVNGYSYKKINEYLTEYTFSLYYFLMI
jgi:hypothetical protein